MDGQTAPATVRWAPEIEQTSPTKSKDDVSDVSVISSSSPTKTNSKESNKAMLSARSESASKISASSVKVAFKDSMDKNCGGNRQTVSSSLRQFLCLPSSFKTEFSSKSLEAVYQHYYEQQKLDRFLYIIILVFTVNMALVAMYGAVFHENSQTQINRLIITCVHGVFYLVLIGLHVLKLVPSRLLKWLPYVVWLVIFLELIVDLVFGYDPLTPSDSVGMFTFLCFITFVMLPARLPVCLAFSLAASITHVIISGTLSTQNVSSFLGNQVSGEILKLTTKTNLQISTFHGDNSLLFLGFFLCRKTYFNRRG